MASSSPNLGILCLVLLGVLTSTTADLISTPDLSAPYPKAISDLKETIMNTYGFQAQGMKITGFDSSEALMGRSVSYEFGLEIDNKVLPFKLLKDVELWEQVDLPIFKEEDSVVSGNENGLVERKDSGRKLPVLAPFQLAGPMELWIQDGKDMRLSLPHDVDAGVLKKVILADGAVVTIKGARSVSLRHPIELPLPLNQTQGLLTLADRLRHTSRSQTDPIVSLRIVGPTSITSPTSSSTRKKLKLKLLAPGLVELSSPSKPRIHQEMPFLDLQGEVPIPATSDQFAALWPLTSLNGSDPTLKSFEVLLTSILGEKAQKEGSFKLVKADVSAQTFVKMVFGVEKKLKDGDLEGFPQWRTKPKSVRMHFEVLGKVDGNKIVPERVVQVDPVQVEDTVAPNVQFGNMTMSSIPIVYPPPSFFSL